MSEGGGGTKEKKFAYRVNQLGFSQANCINYTCFI